MPLSPVEANEDNRGNASALKQIAEMLNLPEHTFFGDVSPGAEFEDTVKLLRIWSAFGLPPERWSSLRYGFAPYGGCCDASEEAYG